MKGGLTNGVLRISGVYKMTKKKQEKKVVIPLRNWHQLKDGTVIDKAYESCIHYYRRDEITHDLACHTFCIDGQCVEETLGKPCCLIQYAPGIKSDKIRYIYFKISELEQRKIEQKAHLPVVG